MSDTSCASHKKCRTRAQLKTFTISLNQLSLNIAIIFDMDGVIVDNHPFHTKAWLQFFAHHKIPMSEEEYKQQINGRPLADIIPRYFGKDFTPAMSRQFGEKKEAVYREIYKDHIVPTPGLVDFLEELEAKNIPKAIATSAPANNVEFTLASTGLKKYFSIITDDAMVTKGKPDPEVYLKTATPAQYAAGAVYRV